MLCNLYMYRRVIHADTKESKIFSPLFKWGASGGPYLLADGLVI